MAEVHGEVIDVMDGIPGLNASLQHVNAHLDDVIGPSVNQLTTNLGRADARLTDAEENIENVLRTWNASHLELTGLLQLQFNECMQWLKCKIRGPGTLMWFGGLIT